MLYMWQYVKQNVVCVLLCGDVWSRMVYVCGDVL